MPGSYDYTKDEMDLIRSVIGPSAHALGRKYHKFCEAQDIAQELWIWALKHPKVVLQFIDREGDELKSGLKGLGKTLYREGDRYCRKEKAALSGYRVSDEYFYSKALIDSLIEADANEGKMLVNQVNDQVRRTKPASEGGDVHAMIADVKRALKVLDPSTEAMLQYHVVDKMSSQQIGDIFEISRQAVDQRIARAYEKMIESLGGHNPW